MKDEGKKGIRDEKHTLYPRYVNRTASVSETKARINCTAQSTVGRLTQRIASQLMMGFSWNSSSVNWAEARNSVLLLTVQLKLHVKSYRIQRNHKQHKRKKPQGPKRPKDQKEHKE